MVGCVYGWVDTWTKTVCVMSQRFRGDKSCRPVTTQSSLCTKAEKSWVKCKNVHAWCFTHLTVHACSVTLSWLCELCSLSLSESTPPHTHTHSSTHSGGLATYFGQLYFLPFFIRNLHCIVLHDAVWGKAHQFPTMAELYFDGASYILHMRTRKREWTNLK